MLCCCCCYYTHKNLSSICAVYSNGYKTQKKTSLLYLVLCCCCCCYSEFFLSSICAVYSNVYKTRKPICIIQCFLEGVYLLPSIFCYQCVCIYLYIYQVVKNKPPRKAIAENLGPFMPTCCFSLIFISFIYIYRYRCVITRLP